MMFPSEFRSSDRLSVHVYAADSVDMTPLPNDVRLGITASRCSARFVKVARPSTKWQGGYAACPRVTSPVWLRPKGGGLETMTSERPHHRHTDDARADDAPPSDGVTDEVRRDSAGAETTEDQAESASPGADSDADAASA